MSSYAVSLDPQKPWFLRIEKSARQKTVQPSYVQGSRQRLNFMPLRRFCTRQNISGSGLCSSSLLLPNVSWGWPPSSWKFSVLRSDIVLQMQETVESVGYNLWWGFACSCHQQLLLPPPKTTQTRFMPTPKNWILNPTKELLNYMDRRTYYKVGYMVVWGRDGQSKPWNKDPKLRWKLWQLWDLVVRMWTYSLQPRRMHQHRPLSWVLGFGFKVWALSPNRCKVSAMHCISRLSSRGFCLLQRQPRAHTGRYMAQAACHACI